MGSNNKPIISTHGPIETGSLINHFLRKIFEQLDIGVNWKQNETAQHIKRHVDLYFDNLPKKNKGSILTLFTNKDSTNLKLAMSSNDEHAIDELYKDIPYDKIFEVKTPTDVMIALKKTNLPFEITKDDERDIMYQWINKFNKALKTNKIL